MTTRIAMMKIHPALAIPSTVVWTQRRRMNCRDDFRMPLSQINVRNGESRPNNGSFALQKAQVGMTREKVTQRMAAVSDQIV